MTRVFLVGLGGCAGAVLRYVIGGYVQAWTKSVHFPYGTLAVNLMGCLVIGIVYHLAQMHGFLSDENRLFIMTGVWGAFTTFSTFSNETMNLFRGGESHFALLNIRTHLILGLAAVWIGQVAAHWIWG